MDNGEDPVPSVASKRFVRRPCFELLCTNIFSDIAINGPSTATWVAITTWLKTENIPTYSIYYILDYKYVIETPAWCMDWWWHTMTIWDSNNNKLSSISTVSCSIRVIICYSCSVMLTNIYCYSIEWLMPIKFMLLLIILSHITTIWVILVARSKANLGKNIVELIPTPMNRQSGIYIWPLMSSELASLLQC